MMTVAILSLLALCWRLERAYRADALIHPGLWYALAWLMAIACYLAVDAVVGVPISDEDLLNNLLSFVTFSAWLFFALSLMQFRRRVRGILEPKLSFPRPFKLFSSVALLGALVNWVVLGAPVGYDDALRQQWLQQIPRVTAITWYLYFLSFPAAIVAGRAAGLWLLYEVRPALLRMLWVFVPAMAGFFWSLGTGGRQAFGFVLLYYIAGGLIAVTTGARQGRAIGLRRALKIAGVGALSILVLAMFVGLTGQSRAKQQGIQQASEFDKYWYLAPIGQFLSYNGMAIATHQAYGTPQRRDLRETGPVSLAGLQSFGLRLFTGWRTPQVEDTNPERDMASSGLPLAYGTRNVFYDFQADFGYEGAFGEAAILVIVSHLLFLFSGRIPSGRLVPAAPLVMALFFWGYSHQFSLLMFNTFAWLFLACVLWDITSKLQIRPTPLFDVIRQHRPVPPRRY